jgi:hypothetical protein
MYKLIKADQDMTASDVIDFLRENDVEAYIADKDNQYKKYMDSEKFAYRVFVTIALIQEAFIIYCCLTTGPYDWNKARVSLCVFSLLLITILWAKLYSSMKCYFNDQFMQTKRAMVLLMTLIFSYKAFRIVLTYLKNYYQSCEEPNEFLKAVIMIDMYD